MDIAQPYSVFSGGRRYKQLNNLVSQTKRAAGINGPQTWLLFDDLAGTSPFQFKPATERIGSRWVGLGGGGSPGDGRRAKSGASGRPHSDRGGRLGGDGQHR